MHANLHTYFAYCHPQSKMFVHCEVRMHFPVLLIELLKLKHQCSTLAYIKNLKYLQCVIIP